MFARRLIITLCLGVFGVSFIAVPASAVDYGGLGGVPANPDPKNPRTKSIFVYTLGPGATKQDGVKIINNTGQTKTIQVYATDSEVASGGSFTCKQKSDIPKKVGSWIKLSKFSLSLPNNGSEVVPFSVLMPLTPDVGEHNGCIVIQAVESAGSGGNGVQLSFRSALRVAITVPGNIIKDIDLTKVTKKPGDKNYVVTASIKNNGNVSIDADIAIFIEDFARRKVYENGGTYPFLAQKQPTDLNYDFPRPFWGGFYKIKGVAKYNSDPAQTIGQGDKDASEKVTSRWFFIQPQPLALLIELLIIAVVVGAIIFFFWRRKKSKNRAKKWQWFVVDQGDTINSLARDFRTNWKLVAKMNKLKAPYELKPGSKVRLPVEAPKKKR